MRTDLNTQLVLMDVYRERDRQYKKFGDDNILSHGPDPRRLACLSEEHGEVSKEVCEAEFGNDTSDALYKELVQTAAVAVAFAETLVRDGRVDILV